MIKNLSFLAVVIATTFTSIPVPIQETKTEVQNHAQNHAQNQYQIGGQHVLFTDHNHTITPGTSAATLENNLRIQEQKLREQARIQTNYSPSYESSPEAEIIGTSHEQCVIYAKRVTGISKSIGWAGNAKPEGQIPQVGSIGLERRYGHAVVIEKIEGEKITITESNFVKGKITRRVLNINDLRGYIYAS